MSHKIMIVDDEPANLRLLERLFRRDYQIIAAQSGAEALELLAQHDVALLITDQRMPGMTGIELLKRVGELRPQTVRIILTGYTDVTALVEAINCGQVYKYVSKPWDNDELRLTVSRALAHYEANRSRHELALTNQRLVLRQQEMTRGFLRAVADALEAKDDYIHGHARRVRGYASAVGRRMGLNPIDLEWLSLAAFLHDVGKIGTPDRVLLKPGSLNGEELAQMRQHTRRGARMLTGIVGLEEVAEAVLHHHEHFDGTGYPDALSGEQIPLLSRIILVADAYDAMTSPRPFREAYPHEVAVERLREDAGKRFDPRVVEAFCKLGALALIRGAVAAGAPAWFPPALTSGADLAALSFDDLVGKVESEPVLAAAVLREANSGSPAPTAKLQLACAALGGARLREVAAACGELSRKDGARWARALRCAEAARLLAEQTAVMDADEAYTLGLTRVVGELLLGSLFPAEAEAMRGLDGGEQSEQEVAAFGVDHAQVGQWLLESCGLPRELTAAVQTHHDVDRINSPVALLLHIAKAVAFADDPYKLASLDSVCADRLYMLRLSSNDLFRIHSAVASAAERWLEPVI